MDAINKENKVLLNSALFFRKVKNSYIPDGSSLQFIVEELISFGATQILIEKYNIASEFVDSLPSSFRNRIVIVDSINTIKRRKAILEPLGDEFSFGVDSIALKSKHHSEILGKSIRNIYFGLYNFLLALEYQAQVDINLNNLKKAIGFLKGVARDPISRANLSIFEGIFNSYKACELDTVKARSVAPGRLIELFNDFVVDETYKSMSRQFYFLGFEDRVKRAITIIRRTAKKLASIPHFSKFLKVGTKVIKLSTGIEFPEFDFLFSDKQAEYLPSIISLDKALTSAKKSWKVVKPDLLEPPILKTSKVSLLSLSNERKNVIPNPTPNRKPKRANKNKGKLVDAICLICAELFEIEINGVIVCPKCGHKIGYDEYSKLENFAGSAVRFGYGYRKAYEKQYKRYGTIKTRYFLGPVDPILTFLALAIASKIIGNVYDKVINKVIDKIRKYAKTRKKKVSKEVSAILSDEEEFQRFAIYIGDYIAGLANLNHNIRREILKEIVIHELQEKMTKAIDFNNIEIEGILEELVMSIVSQLKKTRKIDLKDYKPPNKNLMDLWGDVE